MQSIRTFCPCFFSSTSSSTPSPWDQHKTRMNYLKVASVALGVIAVAGIAISCIYGVSPILAAASGAVGVFAGLALRHAMILSGNIDREKSRIAETLSTNLPLFLNALGLNLEKMYSDPAQSFQNFFKALNTVLEDPANEDFKGEISNLFEMQLKSLKSTENIQKLQILYGLLVFHQKNIASKPKVLQTLVRHINLLFVQKVTARKAYWF